MLIFSILLKVNSYLRVYKRIGLLVNLLSTCIADIVPFTVYMFVWIGSFIILSLILGINPPAREGLMVLDETGNVSKGSQPYAMAMYVWENSIGSITNPDLTKVIASSNDN